MAATRRTPTGWSSIPEPAPAPRIGDCESCGRRHSGACYLATDPIRILAESPDGWAFCRQSGRLILVRPPFGARHRFPQTEAQMERAMRDENFRPCSEEFASWPEVERHLREVVVGSATPEELAMAKDAARPILARGAAASTPLRTHAGGPR